MIVRRFSFIAYSHYCDGEYTILTSRKPSGRSHTHFIIIIIIFIISEQCTTNDALNGNNQYLGYSSICFVVFFTSQVQTWVLNWFINDRLSIEIPVSILYTSQQTYKAHNIGLLFGGFIIITYCRRYTKCMIKP